MLLIDLGLALAVSLVLSWLLLRFVQEHGPWRKPWLFGMVIFLFAWAGGAWIGPGLESGWVTYWIPFVLVGLVTAVLIVAVSPRHELRTDEDTEQFEREEQAVLLSSAVLMWVLSATVVVLGIAAYLR
jgi:hypothetical protein